MTDHELLLAIADIMDKKLDARLTPIEVDIQSMKGDIQSLKDDIQSTKDDIQSMKGDIQSLKDDMQSMKGDIQSMKGDIQSLKLTQENIILPRLNTIESCYTSTYDRYKNYADKMDSAFIDIDLLKKVVSEHSEKLQKIS